MGIYRSSLGDFLNLIYGWTEPLLGIQLVAEGSLSKWRALGVAITKARRVNVEGSAIQFNQRRDAVKSEENVRTFEEECQYNQRDDSAKMLFNDWFANYSEVVID